MSGKKKIFRTFFRREALIAAGAKKCRFHIEGEHGEDGEPGLLYNGEVWEDNPEQAPGAYFPIRNDNVLVLWVANGNN